MKVPRNFHLDHKKVLQEIGDCKPDCLTISRQNLEKCAQYCQQLERLKPFQVQDQVRRPEFHFECGTKRLRLIGSNMFEFDL